MNFSEMMDEWRRRTGYTDKAAMPDRVVVEYFNRALRDPVLMRRAARRGVRTAASVAYQDYYTIPDDLITVERVVFRGTPLSPVDMDDIVLLEAGDGSLNERYRRSDPSFWWVRGREVRLYPIPSTDATQTTLAANMTSDDTTCTVNAVDDGLPVRGRIIIEQEVIEYYNLVDNGSTYTLQGLRRGMEGTQATSHTGALTVTRRDVEMIGRIAPLELIVPPGTGQMEESSQGGNMDAGEYRYIWCYYDPYTGRESLPYELGIINVANDSSAVQITDLQMDDNRRGYQKRIYRTEADSAWPYYLVATVGASVTSYLDTTADDNLSTTEYSEDNVKPDLMPVFYTALVEVAISHLMLDLKRHAEASAYLTLAERKLDNAAELASRGDGPMMRRTKHYVL